MADSGLSAKTIRNTISLLNAAYERAIRLDKLVSNPCKIVVLPKKQNTEKLIFTSEQTFIFLNALNDESLDYKVAYCLAMFCGLRRSEICGLREQDVIIPFKQMTIKQTRHRIDGTNDIIQDAKTERSHRTLAIPSFLVDLIQELIEQHHSNEYCETDYLILNAFCEPISPSMITKKIVEIGDKHGLPHVTAHGLRHTYASLFNSRNIDIARISRELGLSNISTTLNI